MSDKFDVAVLGGGPGGYVAAIRAAQLGAKVALIEQDKVGGTCLNRGCIPVKALIACTSLFSKMQKAESFGISTDNLSIDLKKVIERKNALVGKLVKGVEFLLEKNRVTLIGGTGKVVDPGKIELEVAKSEGSKSSVVCNKLILATGSLPARLPGIEYDGEKFLCSDDLLNLTKAPEKLDIVGGGVIGLHFAVIFSELGTEVTVYEALPEILAGIDEEIVGNLKRILKRKKVNILTNTRFNPADSCGKTLICVGRKPNASGLDGINLQVNEKMETNQPGVYAIGDLVSQKMLAHVAYEQGVIAAENALGANRTFNYDFVPVGIYTHPEIGSIGLTENAAREKFGTIKIGKFPFGALGIAQAMGEIEGLIKVISNEQGKILGIHILGPEATNLIGSAALAMKNNLTVGQLAETFQSHPSYPEGLQEAALSSLKKSLHSIN